MPKEVFSSQYEKNQDPNQSVVRQPELSVHWGSTQGPDVQVGITLDPEAARGAYRRLLEDRKAVTIEDALDVLCEPHSGALGWFTHLDRHDTNRLIKTLRRARDVAFGRDE